SLPPPPPPPVDAGPRPTSSWGLGDAFAAVGLFFAASVLASLVAVATGGGEITLDGPLLPLALGFPALIQLWFVRWVADTKGDGLARDFAFRFEPRDLLVGVAVWFGALLAAGVASVVTFTLVPAEPTARLADLATGSADEGGINAWLILLAVLAVTLVPVVEELVYRGLWWSALVKRGMDERWVLVVTSAVFALVHFEPVRVLILFSLGLVLGWGRLHTGRLAPSIVAHALVNAGAMIALFAGL
ncbi:MAG: CPBP family intramembrane metalloprotease, partial [Actinomyces sp.]